MNGKTIIVTGAGGGVGRGIALEAAAHGANVVVNDLGGSVAGEGNDSSSAQKVVDQIKAAGGNAIASTLSVAHWDSAQEIVQSAIDGFGRVDGIVNNAGILRDKIFHKMSVEEFTSVVQVHLFGSFYMSRAAAPHFKDQKSGAFVHMASTSGLIGNMGQANYSAAKLGIVGLSKSIAMDMALFGVRSNCIAPFAWTRMVGTIPNTPEQSQRLEGLKKLVPEKIAPFTVALLSDAAEDVSGQVFGVRSNEIYLFSQSRPIRAMHTDDGWTVETVLERVIPAMKPSFYPLDKSSDVFCWDPV